MELSRDLKRGFNKYEEWRISQLCMRHGISLNLLPNTIQHFSKLSYVFLYSTALGLVLSASVNKPEYLKQIVSVTFIGGAARAGYDAGRRREVLDKEINDLIKSFNLTKVTTSDN